MDEYYPCALVHWFTHMGDERDEVMDMWVVQPDSVTFPYLQNPP